MKAYTINNCTKDDIIVDWQGKQQIVLANSKQIIEADATDTLRIYKATKKSARLCMAKYFEKDTINRIFMILILLLNFDLYIEVSRAPKLITIKESYYHFYTIFMFSLLQIKDNDKVTYEYHQSSDKKTLLLISSVALFSMTAICLVMTVISLVALFEDFSAFAFFITLITIGLYYLFISFAKIINKFKDFNKNLSYLLEQSKIAYIGYDNGRFIKYWDEEA